MFYIIVILAVIFGMPAKADETLKYRSVYHATEAQAQDIGDVDGHTMSLARVSSLASFADGSVGADNLVSAADYVKGSGPFLVYAALRSMMVRYCGTKQI
jgi:hypothetical protein